MSIIGRLSLLILCAAGPAQAAAPVQTTAVDTLAQENKGHVHVLDPLRVEGRRDDLTHIALSASEGRIGRMNFALRPLLRVGELLETVPGMIVTQHSGTGKGNQMFLRGFNLDHGTDFRTEVEGMPVNLPTNAHGQGYTDLNFLIPELVDFIRFQKGCYYPETGDFGTAGAARFSLARRLERNFLRLETGQGNHRRVVGGASFRVGRGDVLVAGELHRYDGPWDLPENVDKINGMARWTLSSDDGKQTLSLLGLAYDNSWDATDQIPSRAVDTGLVGRFGYLDPTDGGSAARYSFSADWNRDTGDQAQQATAYVYRYRMQLFSNFTGWLEDPANGDQFEQEEDRVVAGLTADMKWWTDWLGPDSCLRVGVQSRSDMIDHVGLHNTRARERVSTVRQDEIFQTLNGAFVGLRTDWSPRFRSEAGVRLDHYHFDVQSDLAANSGTADDLMASPKLTLAWTIGQTGEVYLNGGLGFHSNDARGTTQTLDPGTGLPVDGVDPLVRGRAAEAGVRWQPSKSIRSTLALWGLELASELLYVGDAGATEAMGASRRHGLEWTNYFEPKRWLMLDLDLALTEARYKDEPAGVDRIPGALEQVLTAGVMVRHATGLFGALRLRHLGEYPLTEDDVVRAESTTLVNAALGWDSGAWELAVEALNLFDAEAADIQYYYASRLPDEPAAGIEDIHFHPVEPLTLRGRLVWRF